MWSRLWSAAELQNVAQVWVLPILRRTKAYRNQRISWHTSAGIDSMVQPAYFMIVLQSSLRHRGFLGLSRMHKRLQRLAIRKGDDQNWRILDGSEPGKPLTLLRAQRGVSNLSLRISKGRQSGPTLQRSIPILLASVLSRVLFPAPGGPRRRVMRPGRIVPLILSRMTNLCLPLLRSPVKEIRLCTQIQSTAADPPEAFVIKCSLSVSSNEWIMQIRDFSGT